MTVSNTLEPFNFTRLPNIFWNYYFQLTEGEARTLMLILRKTIGFNKSSDRIPLSQFESEANITKKTASKALKKLIKDGIIVLISKYTKILGAEYQINLNWSSQSDSSTTQNRSDYHLMSSSDYYLNKTDVQKTLKKTDHDASLIKESKSLDNSQIAHNVKKLMTIGIDMKMAKKLAKNYSHEVIANQIQWLESRNAKNPPAYLVKAIIQNYHPPKKFQEKQQTKKEEENKQKQYLNILNQIKKTKAFIIGAIKCQVLSIDGYYVTFKQGREERKRNIRELVECSGIRVC